jgi:hypothetical protein
VVLTRINRFTSEHTTVVFSKAPLSSLFMG